MTHSGLTNQIRLSPQSSSRLGVKIDTFLIHHQASTNDDATINMMINRTRQVSANYCISNEGRLTCVVDEDLRAWTSGSSTDGGKGAAWDRRSITVEIENETGAPGWQISQAAVDTAARLLNDLRKRYGVSIVLGHRDLWSRYRASYATYCPGPETVNRIIARAAELDGQPAPSFPSTPTTPPAGGAVELGEEAGVQAWLGLQRMLAKLYGYQGIIDGIPGPLTWGAMQRFLKAHWGYTGIVDGIPGKLSWGAAQRWLKAKYGYEGPVDGIPGPFTFAALTRAGIANAAVYGGGVTSPTAPVQSLPKTIIDGIPGKITWTRLQTWLKQDWGYAGVVDGVPGKLTWGAFQRFLKSQYGYTGIVDGIPGKLTYSALQRFAKAHGYTGPVDGVPGVNTWKAIQRFANTV